MTEKKWSTIYIPKEILEELKNLDISLMYIQPKALSDKIAMLIAYYKQSKEKK